MLINKLELRNDRREIVDNINTKLICHIFDRDAPHYEYGVWKEEYESLIVQRQFVPRQKEALKTIENILAAHGKEDLLKQISELAKVEVSIRELQPWQRDHVVHALLSFFLGIYINEFFIKKITGKRTDPFQWKIAGLLHDIAYPVQISQGIAKRYSDKINEIKDNLILVRPDVYFSIVPRNLDILQNNVNSFVLIQNQIKKWKLQIDVKAEYERMVDTGQTCHGMISGLSILYVIDMMYQKYNPRRVRKSCFQPHSNVSWNQKYFEDAIVPSCSAIFLHNLRKGCFEKAKINMRKAPIAFLLKLSDLLQEWERPSFKDKKGFSSYQFDIDMRKDELIFKADIPEERKNNLREELYAVLDAESVKMV